MSHTIDYDALVRTLPAGRRPGLRRAEFPVLSRDDRDMTSTFPPTRCTASETHGQDHVLHGWDALDRRRARALRQQLSAIDFARTRRTCSEAAAQPSADPATGIAPLPVDARRRAPPTSARVGEEALRAARWRRWSSPAGRAAGSGSTSRRGCSRSARCPARRCSRSTPRRCWPCRAAYGKPIPFLVMTSPATDADTRDYFQENHFFGLRRTT